MCRLVFIVGLSVFLFVGGCVLFVLFCCALLCFFVVINLVFYISGLIVLYVDYCFFGDADCCVVFSCLYVFYLGCVVAVCFVWVVCLALVFVSLDCAVLLLNWLFVYVGLFSMVNCHLSLWFVYRFCLLFDC